MSVPYATTFLVVLLSVASVFYLCGHEAALRSGVDAPDARPGASSAAAVPAPAGGAAAAPAGDAAAEGAHIYFVLDRSGSMASIAGDVVGGFNAFVTEQRALPGRLRMTLLQFDSQDPHEVVFAGRDIMEVPLLGPDDFRPRSATPLFDALGHAIELAEEQASARPEERVVLVTFSDGAENASRRHTRSAVFDRIAAKQREGWAFVFLGANQDSYAAGGGLGFGAKNTQNFAFDSAGTRVAFQAVSEATKSMRSSLSSGQRASYDSEDYFGGKKAAEQDYEARRSQ